MLAEIYADALQANGIRVIRSFDLGARELLEPALERGLVELVPEYSGAALTFLGGEATPDAATTHDRLVDAFAARGITVLAAAPGQDQDGFAVTQQTAAERGLHDLSDLTGAASDLVFGGPPECPERPLCLPGLERVYGLRFRDFVPLDAGGPLTLSALRGGLVQVALVFTSDGALQGQGLVPLRDDLGLEPAENVTPVVSSATVERFGDRLTAVVDRVSSFLTTDEIRSLNAKVALDGLPVPIVARDWLRIHGLDQPVR